MNLSKQTTSTMKRKCDNCGKEYEADERNIKRGWGLTCSKSCAASKREKSKPNYNMLIVDDTYRPFRRKLHYTQPAKGNVRKKYSTGNFRGVRKGTICELGQICGGKKNYFMIMPYVNRLTKEKRIEKSIKKISWLSHNFKVRKVMEEEDD